MIKFIENIILALILTVVTNAASWFIIQRGKVTMFVIFLVCLCVWPLVKIFAAKKKPAREKMHRSFSDAVCSILGMISSWANRKQVSMAGENKPAVKTVSKENPPAEDPVKATIHEVEEELKGAGDDPDPDEEIPPENFTD